MKRKVCDRCYKYSWIKYKYVYYDGTEKKKLLCLQCIKIAMTYNYEVIVSVRDPGRFGGYFISGVYRSPWEEKRIIEEIAQQIRRHVDDVGNAQIVKKKYTPKEFWSW